MALLDGCVDFAEARSLLLRTIYDDTTGWKTHDKTPIPAAASRVSGQLQPPSPFALHEELVFRNEPSGSSEVTVHRFVCESAVSMRLNAALLQEAHAQSSWPMRALNGVSISNVEGFHSSEESFVGAGEADDGYWYSALLAEVLLPALRTIGPAAEDSDGLPEGARIAGWLNVSGPHAYNRLHHHGDAVWSLVYFVASGDTTQAPVVPADQPAAGTPAGSVPSSPTDDDSVAGGGLLLATHPDPDTGQSAFLAVPPHPGELWCFPGHLPHAVLPRKLRPAVAAPAPASAQAAAQATAQATAQAVLAPAKASLGVLGTLGGYLIGERGELETPPRKRVSVACNMYATSSPYRDARIGHDRATGKRRISQRQRDCCLGMQG